MTLNVTVSHLEFVFGKNLSNVSRTLDHWKRYHVNKSLTTIWVLRTRPDQLESTVKIVFVNIAHHRGCLVADLLVCPKHDKQKPNARTSFRFDQVHMKSLFEHEPGVS